jgi:hypothetical protein
MIVAKTARKEREGAATGPPASTRFSPCDRVSYLRFVNVRLLCNASAKALAPITPI